MKNQNKLNWLLNDYNQAWYDKDIEKLKSFYDENLIYYDNHKGNDTYSLDGHLKLVSDFFEKGKNTESGAVEELLIENLNIFSNESSACFCYFARYKSFPNPAVRTTMYLQKQENNWKILHVHCSFEP